MECVSVNITGVSEFNSSWKTPKKIAKADHLLCSEPEEIPAVGMGPMPASECLAIVPVESRAMKRARLESDLERHRCARASAQGCIKKWEREVAPLNRLLQLSQAEVAKYSAQVGNINGKLNPKKRVFQESDLATQSIQKELDEIALNP